MVWNGNVSLGERTLSSGSDPQRGMRAEGCLTAAFPAAPSFLKEDLLAFPSINIVYPLPRPYLPLIIFTFLKLLFYLFIFLIIYLFWGAASGLSCSTWDLC